MPLSRLLRTRFIGQFRFYAPFNAMLVHLQMPGARYVASPSAWLRNYHRSIKPGTRPLVILRPMGPVMFVFDVSDTTAMEGAPPLLPRVEGPFNVRRGTIGNELTRTRENAKRDGVEVTERQAGSQGAGEVRVAKPGRYLKVLIKEGPKAEHRTVSLRYEVLLNGQHPAETKYASLAHELGHLYCGHLGTPNSTWWPDRRGIDRDLGEFEAESICSLVCSRLGIENPSAEYLAGYLKAHKETPPISLDCVLRAAGLIEQIARERLKPRNEKDS
jgi:hypothetical protein